MVGVYETMPTPGYDYQSWMLAEVQALEKAVTDGVSTEKLVTLNGASGERGISSRSKGWRAAVRAHDPRSGQLPDRAGPVHGPDRIERGGKDDAVPGDPRPAGGERGARAFWRGRPPPRARAPPSPDRLRAAEVPVRPGCSAARTGSRRARHRRAPSRCATALPVQAGARRGDAGRRRRRALRRHACREALRRRAAAHPDRARADRPAAAAAAG